MCILERKEEIGFGENKGREGKIGHGVVCLMKKAKEHSTFQ